MSHASALWRSGVAVAALMLAGCAGFDGPDAPPFRDPTLSMPSAQALIIPGQSSRRDVSAALGTATVVVFDSGFEVWAYREKLQKNPPDNDELVILFAPSGIVKKTRLRPLSAPSLR